MEYKASFDTLTKVITLGAIALFIVIGQKIVTALLASQGDTKTILLQSGILLLFVIILVGSYLFSIQKYLIENNKLIIKRPIGERRISITNITEIRLVNEGDMAVTIKTFGNGGLFGYYGQFRNRTFGSITLYTTQRANRVFIKTKSGKKIIISPDDLSLVEKLKTDLSNNQ